MKAKTPWRYRDRRGESLATVTTILEPAMRPAVDAAAPGYFSAIHTDSPSEAATVLRERPAHAVLVSPRAIGLEQLPAVRSLVDRFPGVAAVAVVSERDAQSGERLLQLGGCGVRRLVDLRAPDGWDRLRQLVADLGDSPAGQILAAVVPALGAATPQTRYFFEQLVRVAPGVRSGRGLALWLRVTPTTLACRFYRAGLPSPKQYLAATRLLYVASLLRVPGLSVADVGYRLDFSSPQSFGRHVRCMVGITAAEFRRRYDLAEALADYNARLVTPFEATFRTFQPLQPP